MQFINLKDVDLNEFKTSQTLKKAGDSSYDEYEEDFGDQQNGYSNQNNIQLNILSEFETSYFVMKRMNRTDFLVFPAEFKDEAPVKLRPQKAHQASLKIFEAVSVLPGSFFSEPMLGAQVLLR